MSALHEALKTLGPVDFSDVPQDDLKPFFSNAFSNGQLIVDSVPTPDPPNNLSLQAGRTRQNGTSSGASSESDISTSVHSLPPAPNIQALQKEWKSVKLNSKDNPLGISVYKVGSKDKRGAWFARRSVHEGLGFKQWKRALESEFHETMKVEGGPGEGNIRGIGGEKRIEHRHIDGIGKVEVYLLSAQFPGPTAPRDFVTMFITSDQLPPEHLEDGEELRHFMVISRPCLHKDTGPRDGYVRGHYESVEYIREHPRKKAHLQSTSTTELNGTQISEKSIPLGESQNSNVNNDELENSGKEDKEDNAVEWIMITRSDPGGNVPRFMVERGTPGGIVSDASKFLDWARSNDITDLDSEEEIPGREGEEANMSSDGRISNPGNEKSLGSSHTNSHLEGERDTQSLATSTSRGLTTLSRGGVPATTAGDANEPVSSHITDAVSNQRQPSTPKGEQRNIANNGSPLHRTSSSISSVSSGSSFASALEAIEEEGDNVSASTETTEAMGVGILDHKQLKKLELKKKKLDDKLNKAREKEASKRNDDSPKTEEAIRKAEEKHRKEVERLERKKHKEIRKVEEKKRKTEEKDEKTRMLRELEDVRAEVNLLKKEKEELKGQVIELQATNKALVEKTGS